MKILLIQFKRIGDLILTSPVLAVLKKHFPNAELELAAEYSSAGILPAFPAHTARIFRRGSMNLAAIAAITNGRYDICLDFNGSDRSLMVSGLSRAPRKITYQKISKKLLRSRLYTDWVDSPLKKRHTVDHFLDILHPLGIYEENVRPCLNVPDEIRDRTVEILKSAGVEGPYAIIHPGAARIEKIWSPKRWVEVIRWLKREKGINVIVTGVKSDREFAGVDKLLKMAEGDAIDMVEKLTLMEMAAAIEKAKIVCSVDSSPVHLAEALNTPVVALYGPMNPFVWRPRHTVRRLVNPFVEGEGQAFSPETPTGEMKGITVEKVLRNIAEIF